MTAFLEIDGISVSYGGGVPVLKNVSLSLDNNEVVTVLGANGAGKSTLLRAISGLIPLLSGSLRLEGADISRLSASRRVELGLVHVPEGRQMLSDMSVRENLLLGAYVRRREAVSAIAATEQEVYELFPVLLERQEQLAGSMSGGQQQMLALGRALMAKPRLLMCDEPSLGIAPLIVNEIFAAIANLRARGIPVLLVEQNAKKALAFADRGIVLKRGEVMVTGSASDLAASGEVSAAYLGR